MTDRQTLIAYARMSGGARALLAFLVRHGACAMTAAEFGAWLAVSERTIHRAVRELTAFEVVTATATRGRGGCLRIQPKPDIDAVLRRLCQHIGREDEPQAGQEYTRLADEDAVRRDRARYCHATQTGPKWARELGARMARGEA